MIHSFDYCQRKVGDLGKVVGSKGDVVEVEGFEGGRVGEGVAFEGGSKGMVESVSGKKVRVMVLSREGVKMGSQAARTDKPLRVTAGEGLLGHTLTALGYLMDHGKEASEDVESRVVQAEGWGIGRRARIGKQFLTGVGVSDLLLPLGEGQRELIIGDKKTGKTEWLLQVVVKQAKLGKVCMYGLIGKRQAEIGRIERFLEDKGVRDKVILVAGPAGVSAGEIFLVPFTVMAMAEHFRDLGKDSVVVFDDLTVHAKYFRELALLAGRFPGRESYPGEIFYTHAQLLERAGNFVVDGKQVSITALPVAESWGGDLTGYVQTNLMSMTDGHLYFDGEMFLRGVRPPINVFLSVTRVGKQTQKRMLQELGREIVKVLKERKEMERYLKFGAEMTEEVREVLRQGDGLRRVLRQGSGEERALELMAVMTGLVLVDRWQGEGVSEWVKKWNEDESFREKIREWVEKSESKDEFLQLLGGEDAVKAD